MFPGRATPCDLPRPRSSLATCHPSLFSYFFYFCRVLRRPTKPDGYSSDGIFVAQSPILPAHFVILSPDLGRFRRITHHATARARLGAWSLEFLWCLDVGRLELCPSAFGTPHSEL